MALLPDQLAKKQQEIAHLQAALDTFPVAKDPTQRPEIKALNLNEDEENANAGFSYGDSKVIIDHSHRGRRYIKIADSDRTRKLELLIWSEINLWDNWDANDLPRQFILAEQDNYTTREIHAAIRKVMQIPEFKTTQGFRNVTTVSDFKKRLNVTSLNIREILQQDNLNQFNRFRRENGLGLSCIRKALQEHIASGEALPPTIMGYLFKTRRYEMIHTFFKPLLCDEGNAESRSKLANRIATDRALVHELHRKKSFLPLIEAVMEAGDFTVATKLARGFQHLKGMRSDSGIRTVVEKTLEAFDNAATDQQRQACIELFHSCYSLGYDRKNIGNWLFPLTARLPKKSADSFAGFNMLLAMIEADRPVEQARIQVIDNSKSNPESIKGHQDENFTHRLVYNEKGDPKWILDYVEDGIVFKREIRDRDLKNKTFENIDSNADENKPSALYEITEKINSEQTTAYTDTALNILKDKSSSDWRLEMLYKLIDSSHPQKHQKISRFLSKVNLSEKELKKTAEKIVKNGSWLDTVLNNNVELKDNAKEALLLATVREEQATNFEKVLAKFTGNFNAENSKKYLKEVVAEKDSSMLQSLLNSGKLDQGAILDFAVEMSEWTTLKLYSSFLHQIVDHETNGVKAILQAKDDDYSLDESKLALINFMLGDENAPEDTTILMGSKLAQWLEKLDAKDNKYLEKISEKAQERSAASTNTDVQKLWLNLHTAAQKSSKRDSFISRNAQNYLPNILQNDSKAVQKIIEDINSNNADTRESAFNMLNNYEKSGLRLDVLISLIRSGNNKTIQTYLNKVTFNKKELEKATEFFVQQDLKNSEPAFSYVYGKFLTSLEGKTNTIKNSLKKELIRKGKFGQQLSEEDSKELLYNAIKDNDKELVERLLPISNSQAIISVASKAIDSVIDRRAGFSSSLDQLINDKDNGAKNHLMWRETPRINKDSAALCKYIINSKDFDHKTATSLLENFSPDKKLDNALKEIADYARKNFDESKILSDRKWRKIFITCYNNTHSRDNKKTVANLLFPTVPFGVSESNGFKLLLSMLKNSGNIEQQNIAFEILNSHPESNLHKPLLLELIPDVLQDKNTSRLLDNVTFSQKALESAIEVQLKLVDEDSSELSIKLFNKLVEKNPEKITNRDEIKASIISNTNLLNKILNIQGLSNSSKNVLLVSAIKLQKVNTIGSIFNEVRGNQPFNEKQSETCLRAALKINDADTMQTVMNHCDKLNDKALLKVANEAISLTNLNKNVIDPLVLTNDVAKLVSNKISQNIDLAKYIVKHGNTKVDPGLRHNLWTSINSYQKRHQLRSVFSFFSEPEPNPSSFLLDGDLYVLDSCDEETEDHSGQFSSTSSDFNSYAEIDDEEQEEILISEEGDDTKSVTSLNSN